MNYLSSVADEDICKHRNLKSSNCLVGKNWEVKVSDYGLHKLKDAMQTVTAVGNVSWAAPEQLLGETSAISVKTPVYSFGIILWEILTRGSPFAGVHPTRLVTQVIAGARPEIPNNCPAAFRTLIEQCWQHSPDKRPTWPQILSDLRSMTGQVSISIN